MNHSKEFCKQFNISYHELITLRNTLFLYAYSDRAKNKDYYKYGDLYCMCLTASVCLHQFLSDKGIKSDLTVGRCQNRSHAWVVVNNNYIVDLTATQFNRRYKGVHIVRCPNRRYKEFDRGNKVKIQKWTKGQRVTKKEVRHLLRIHKLIL